MSEQTHDTTPMQADPAPTFPPMPRSRPLSPSRALAEQMKADIRSGALELGSNIGSVRQAADRYSVSLGAAKVAFEILRNEGWLLTINPRDGHYVTSTLPTPGDKPLTLEQRVMRLEKHTGILDAQPDAQPDAQSDAQEGQDA